MTLTRRSLLRSLPAAVALAVLPRGLSRPVAAAEARLLPYVTPELTPGEHIVFGDYGPELIRVTTGNSATRVEFTHPLRIVSTLTYSGSSWTTDQWHNAELTRAQES